MIDHRRALTLATTAIDFPLGTADRDALDEHARGCADCRAELSGFRRDAARLAALPPIAPPSWVRGTIGRPRRANPFMLLAAAVFLLTAASLAVIVGSGLLPDRSAVLVPTAQPKATVSATVAATASATPALPTSTPIAQPSGYLLVRLTNPALTGQVATTFGLIDLADGTYRSLGVAVDAVLSADGSRVHLVREDATCTPTLVSVDLQGNELERIKGSFAPGDGSFAWSPDDRQVVFSRYVHGQPKRMCGSQGGDYGPAALLSVGIVIDAAGAWKVGAPLVSASAPARYGWSPDGSSISIAWSSDGSPISIADASPRLWVVDPTSAAKVDLGPQLTGIGATDLNAVFWAPDGRSIAFVYSGPSGPMVGLVALAGPTARTIGLPGDAVSLPAWAPDGRAIAVVRGLNGGTLTLLDPDVVRPEVSLTKLAIDGSAPFGWSPDGAWLACTAYDGTVALVAATGSDVRTVFRPAAGLEVQFVGWSPG